ncbi:MAG: SPASM domain-containing protein, partial [Candidatus Binatia bacterium]|nr:SPASM domain-containing protein [Candidatus Binatia bacterium]
LDANDADTYRAMRGRDHFERVCANITALLARKRALGLRRPVVSLQVLLAPENRAALPAIIERWQPLLTDADFVMTIEPSTFGRQVDVPPPAVGPRQPCRWLFEALIVLQDGTVTTCGTDWDAQAPVGNAAESSLYAIWNGAEMQRRRALHLARQFERLPLCASCTDWPLADGHGYRNVSKDTHPTRANPKHRLAIAASTTLM